MWIKCSDKLPKKGVIVLISNDVGVGVGFMGLHGAKRSKKNPIFFRPIALDPIQGIVAWQPMPEVYSE